MWGTLNEVEGLSEKLSPEGHKGGAKWRSCWWMGEGDPGDGVEENGRGGKQQGQGLKYILEAESLCGQSRVTLWSADRREADFHEAQEWLAST